MVFAIAFLAIAGSTPLFLHEQLMMLVSMWGMTLIVRRAAGLAKVAHDGLFSIILPPIALPYWWRLTRTRWADSGDGSALWRALIAAECHYVDRTLVLGYVQNARPPLRHPVPWPHHQDRNCWPTVERVHTHVQATTSRVVQDPPFWRRSTSTGLADKLSIYVLDDGRRAEAFREFASRHKSAT